MERNEEPIDVAGMNILLKKYNDNVTMLQTVMKLVTIKRVTTVLSGLKF